jgi:hypothetical protein
MKRGLSVQNFLFDTTTPETACNAFLLRTIHFYLS